MQGVRDNPRLTEEERIHYGTVCHAVAAGWERSFIAEQDGGVASAVLERDKLMVRNVIGPPGHHKFVYRSQIYAYC